MRVRASAGSGKTYTLTGHFLRLLAEAGDADVVRACGRGADGAHAWPEILAVTFTNRAAAEMKERIIRRLKLMALGREEGMPAPWTEGLAAEWLETVLRRFGALNVRTIDSLLHMLVRLAALELGLPPDFEPVFADREALAPLLDEILERARHDAPLREEVARACRILLEHTPHRGFMAGQGLRERVLDLVFTVQGLGGERMASAEEVAGRLEALCCRVRECARALRECVEREELPLRRDAEKALEACLGGRDRDLPPSSVMLRKDGLDACLLKAGQGSASAGARLAYERVRAAVAVMDEQAALLRGALTIMPFLRLARQMAEELPDYLQSQSQLPAGLTPGLARRVLEGGYGVSAAFCRMGTNLTHILIDEFQDTSREQWAALHPLALEALSRGGSLAWVGDVKQAIYGWRGGDAALFDEVARDEELLAVAGAARTDTLPVNWRSRAAVVRANNSVFARLARIAQARAVLAAMLPDETPADVLEANAARLAHGFADAAQLESGKEGGFVRLDRLETNAKAAILNRLAALALDVATRRPPGDITVLVRSNDQAAEVAARLLAEGLPVVTENSLLLAEHPLIGQCVAFLRWLNVPYDETAFWSVIAGPRLLLPLAELPRERLEDWLVERDRARPVAMAFREAFPDAWRTWLEPFFERAGLMTPYDAVREMLEHWRIWERMPHDAPFVQRFLEILHGAEREGYTSAASFLAHWEARGGEEKAPMPDTVDAVRVMTVHKSKGLQFPVVIAPWNDFTPKAEAVPVEMEVDGLRLITPRRAGTGPGHYAALADAARESVNLLYVAWTRAEDELYAFLHTGRGPGLGRGLEGLLAETAGPGSAWKEDGGTLRMGKEPASSRPAVSGAEAGEAATERRELAGDGEGAASWRPMGWLPRLRIFRSAPDDLVFSARRRGSFVHACLECLAEEVRILSDDEFVLGNAAMARMVADAVSRAQREFPLPVPDDVPPEARDSVQWFAGLPGALGWLRAGTAEQPLLDDEGAQYRPDLMAPVEVPAEEGEGEKSWLVIEYKTGRPEEAHAAQLRRYLDLLGRVAGRPARGRLIYLDARFVQDVESVQA